MTTYKTNIKSIDSVKTAYYNKDDMLVRVPHEIPTEDIEKLTILEKENMYGGKDYFVVIKETPEKYTVTYCYDSEKLAIEQYFWRKLNELKLDTCEITRAV